MSFIESIKQKAKENIKRIVLPEAEDIRVLKAAEIIGKEDFSEVILIGDIEKINEKAKSNNIDISKAILIEPELSKDYEKYADSLHQIRQRRGMTIDIAKKTLLDPVYFGMMMVNMGDADGLVSGAIHSTADTLRPALQIIKTAPETKVASGAFIMVIPNSNYGDKGVLLFADCALNQNPDENQLSEIAISSANTYRKLIGCEPKVAMLSYSTYGSAESSLTKKMITATELVKEKSPDLLVDGELQLDAAIVESVANLKAPNSKVAGKANVLIFPDLNSGNIGYKLVQRFANAEAYGPLTQGLLKPVNDLSRGCSAEDIVGVVALTAVQSMLNN